VERRSDEQDAAGDTSPSNDLIHIVALSGLLLEELERLEGQFASEALTTPLRELYERAHAELERLAWER
jgi:hypothetical protein